MIGSISIKASKQVAQGGAWACTGCLDNDGQQGCAAGVGQEGMHAAAQPSSHFCHLGLPLSSLTSSPPASSGPQMPGREGAWKSPVTVHATTASAGQVTTGPRRQPSLAVHVHSHSKQQPCINEAPWAAQAACASTQPAPTAAHSHPPLCRRANRTCCQEADQPLAENDGAHALTAVHAVVSRQENQGTQVSGSSDSLKSRA